MSFFSMSLPRAKVIHWMGVIWSVCFGLWSLVNFGILFHAIPWYDLAGYFLAAIIHAGFIWFYLKYLWGNKFVWEPVDK